MLKKHFAWLMNFSAAQRQIKILRRHRLDLLEEIHSKQKSLDLIDYIIYKIRQGTLKGGAENDY